MEKTSNPSSAGELSSSLSIDQIVAIIREEEARVEAEEAKSASNEGRLVQAHIAIGCRFVQLKAAVKKVRGRWATRIAQLGYAPRVARRYLKLGQSWWGGLNESVLNQLPRDLEKLDWLCRLSKEQLDQVLEKHNCKRLDRSEVVNIVKEMIGPHTNRKSCDPGTLLHNAVKRFFTKSVVDAEKWGEKQSQTKTCRRILQTLDNGYQELRKALSIEDVQEPKEEA
jgi:hypothetical protein